MNEKDKIIWENVDLLRRQKGWTKRYLAGLVKSDPQTLNNMRTGERGIGPDMLKRFARAFGVRQGDLMRTRQWTPATTIDQQEEIEILKKRVHELESHQRLIETVFVEHAKRPPDVPEERRELNKKLHQIIGVTIEDGSGIEKN